MLTYLIDQRDEVLQYLRVLTLLADTRALHGVRFDL